MSLLVTGTVGIDSVVTPQGRADEVLGGSATYFSFAASLFARVRLVAVVGDDFPGAFRDLLASADIDLAGLETRAGSRTFRWTGKYLDDMNQRETLDLQLNVISEDPPKVPPEFADSQVVFLANTHPALQRGLLEQVKSPRLTVCDSMDVWIENEADLRMIHSRFRFYRRGENGQPGAEEATFDDVLEDLRQVRAAGGGPSGAEQFRKSRRSI